LPQPQQKRHRWRWPSWPRILRIKRRQQDSLATKRVQIVERRRNPRIAVAHCEIDDDFLFEPLLQRFRLPPRDRSER